MAINRPNDRFSIRSFRLKASTPPAIEHLPFASPDSCAESVAEPSIPEPAMITQQAMMKDTLSPHTPSPSPADGDETVTGTDNRLLRRPPAPTRRIILATQARCRYVGDAFRGASSRKSLGRTRHLGSAAMRPRPAHRRKAQTSHRPLRLGGAHPPAQVIQPRFAGLQGERQPGKMLK
jgi:hypothetical protein